MAALRKFDAAVPDTPSRSRGSMRPRFASISPPSIVRGRRECRMRAAPEVPCAMCRRVRARAYRAAENIRHPLRNGFTAYSVLSPENGSFASVVSGIAPANLTPAPRRQDHTSSPYALMPFAIGTASVHRDPPHDRGDHDTPLLPGRDGDRCAPDLAFGKSEIFFILGRDTVSEN